MLGEDFVRKIPSEQQSVIGFALEQLLRRHDGNVRAGREAALLVSAAVGDKIQRVRAHAVVVQQRAAFGGRAVGGDAFAFLLQLGEQRHEVILDRADLIAEAFVVGERVDTFARFLGEQIGGGFLDGMRTSVSGKQTQ